VRLSLRDSNNADAAFQCFATNYNLNKLTRSREIAVVKICPRLVFSTLKANMTNVVRHERRSGIARIGRQYRLYGLRLVREARLPFMVCVAAPADISNAYLALSFRGTGPCVRRFSYAARTAKECVSRAISIFRNSR
jgi:hypothetical protein